MFFQLEFIIAIHCGETPQLYRYVHQTDFQNLRHLRTFSVRRGCCARTLPVFGAAATAPAATSPFSP
jgi:hypothetical protein